VIRDATVLDAEVLTEFRLAMMDDAGFLADAEDVAAVRAATLEYMGRALPAGELRCWLAEMDGAPVASAGVIVLHKPPGAAELSGREAYILNVYTLPEHRGRGIATSLTTVVLQWCEAEGIRKISLHATHAGARIYRRFGFEDDPRAMVRRRY
jgi:GNAT superfamily N-acetyltransferase